LRLYNSQHDSIKHEEEGGGKRNLEGFETPFEIRNLQLT